VTGKRNLEGHVFPFDREQEAFAKHPVKISAYPVIY
jgi:hypothetical protein